MHVLVLVTAAAVASLATACAQAPVTPIPELARRSVTSIAGDVSGLKNADTSRLGARGSSEGVQLGAQQGASVLPGGGGILGLAVMGVGAIVGGVKGANEAQREDVVDQTRVFLRTAIEDTDFTELLRSRLTASKGAGDIEIVNMTSEASPLASVANSAAVTDHFLVIEYRLGLQREHLVNPTVGILVLARVQVWDPRLKQHLHQATWAYCGDRYHFVTMAANNGAALRAQIDQAAAVLAEAIPYDLYVSKRPRPLQTTSPPCMDFGDLPSGVARRVRTGS
ncbi:hypothetical protein BH11PSE3_BH11PSE3_25710 [soil metagenome]